MIFKQMFGGDPASHILGKGSVILDQGLTAAAALYKLYPAGIPALRLQGELAVKNAVVRVIAVSPDRVSIGISAQNIRNRGEKGVSLFLHKLGIALKSGGDVHIEQLVNIDRLSLVVGFYHIKLLIHHGRRLRRCQQTIKGLSHGNAIHHRSVRGTAAAKGLVMACSHRIPVQSFHWIHIQTNLHGKVGKHLLGFCQQTVQKFVIVLKKQLVSRAVLFRDTDLVKTLKCLVRRKIPVHLFYGVAAFQIRLESDPPGLIDAGLS